MKRTDDAMAETAATVKCDLAVEILRSFGNLRFAATGCSMLPALWPGETLVVQRVGREQLKVGEVVLVGRNGGLCAHRLVSKADGLGEPQWITQGDGLPVPDVPVSENELLGRVAYVIRAGRLIPVATESNFAERLTAKIVRSSVPAARALVFIHRMIHPSKKLDSKDTVSTERVPCQS
jgi:hypothetical protein